MEPMLPMEIAILFVGACAALGGVIFLARALMRPVVVLAAIGLLGWLLFIHQLG
jgi:hypothetical protein